MQAALHAVWVRLSLDGTRSSSLVALPDRGAIHYAFIHGLPLMKSTDHSHLLVLPRGGSSPR